jgi:hypothetical protein
MGNTAVKADVSTEDVQQFTGKMGEIGRLDVKRGAASGKDAQEWILGGKRGRQGFWDV